ncbi:PREDICTED: sister-chromatid cohesion protein 3-like isoform X2 [Lupinus angustifolius]|uniref:sister-chromatid cohesion protein 3-like isoform X2 n=1 Tax=Lupinus angustifolius TaxID=3871 RepID=UPI00092F1CA5|nr:PREDICTED: sister-chromatid cohesion protein 3-like isoform X2 [Lupinus angustifolius]
MEEDSLPPPSQVSTRRSKRGRPPKPKPNDTVSEHRENSLDAPKRPKSKRSRFQQGTSSVAQQASDLTLIEAIKGNGKLIPHVVKLWVERYEMEPKPAMDELLTMLFQACGAKDYNKADLVDEIDVDDVVVALVNCAISGEIEDYHNSKKEFKNFKENLESFWHNLVCECQHGPLFDQVLFDKCMDYITALSCTPPRVYRQVASLMGLELVTSYITIANMLGGQRETTRRQLDAEKKKRNERPLLESLNKRFSDTHEKITLLEEMMRKIFTGLFVHRYRDIDPTIRKSCIQSLGLWVLSYPSLFLQDLYLKYLGWALNDRNAGVRKTSIKALENLYEADDNVPSLGLFTERFSRRMIEITDDIDVSVAVCAVGLVKQLLRHQLIPEDDLAPLYDLLAVDPPEIRHAIGALVYDHLIAQKFNSSQSASRDNSSEVHLKRMLRILEEFPQNPILSIYVIDDVWDYMKAIKDWKCIASMLLDENPLIELSDRDVSNLVRLLCASVKKAVGERIIPVTDDRKQYHNRAQKEAYESNKQDITVALMKSYPLLLRKFISDKEKVSSLVEIILYMDLDLYSLKRQEQSFKNILQLIKEAFFKHGDKDTLRACVKAIDFCCEETEGELQDIAHNKVKELEDEFILKLKSAIKVVVDGGDEYSLLVNSKRLYELHLLIYVPIDNNLYDDIVMVLRGFRNMEDEVVGFLLLSMYLHMAWGLLSIINEEVVYEASLASLLYKRDTLLQELEYFCNLGTDSKEGGKQGSELACRVCIIFSEIWFLFRRENFFETPLERLLYEPNEYVLRKFWKLCEQLLNVSEEEEDEYINREYFEETNRYIVIIAAIKLVAFDAVPKEYLASEIISHFVMHGTSVAEIVKHLITLLKEKDDDLAAILLKALKKAYHRRVVDISGPETDSSDSTSLSGCKDLAAELSGTFIGAELVKHKAVILEIVREGIEYAFVDAPTQLSFLEAAVLQFVPKLPASDVLEIMDDVQKRTENVNTEEDPSGWRPYHTFISLLEKYVNNDVNQEEIEGASVSRKGHPRKPQNMEGKKLFDDQSSSDDEDSLSEYEDVHDEEEGSQEEEDEDEDSPFIFSIKSSSKLMSLGNKGQTKAGTSVSAVDDLSASKTSGASN